MYSLMNVGKNYYLHLHAEQVLAEVMEPSEKQQNRGLLEETITPSVVRRILQEPLKRVRIFMETNGIMHLDTMTLDALQEVIAFLLQNENEIYLLGCNEDLKKLLKKRFTDNKYCIGERYSPGNFWYLDIGLPGRSLCELDGKRCSEILYEIHNDNLRILVEDGPKGKSMDVKRLLEDGEDCVHYYSYRLSQRMVEEGLILSNPGRNESFCLVPCNEAGEYLSKELSIITGASICNENSMLARPGDMRKYILVRDVIHMFCELNRLTNLIEQEGGIVSGSACLIDINTGVGSRKNRVSLFTIDLEKGISYRLRHKKKEE